jgi:hypothetical protein
MEKVLFVEIHSLDNERGCYASNRHFAQFFGVSERQIRTYIASLKEKGFVTVTIKDRYDRTIRVTGKYARASSADLRRLQQSRQELVHKWRIPGGRGGKKTSGGVGRNAYATPEENFHRVIQE